MCDAPSPTRAQCCAVACSSLNIAEGKASKRRGKENESRACYFCTVMDFASEFVFTPHRAEDADEDVLQGIVLL